MRCTRAGGAKSYFSGNVGIGDSSPAALFTVGDGDDFQINTTGAITAATGITSSSSITFSGLTAGGVVQAASGTGLLSVGTLGASSISADSLDFTEFKDALALDAATDIALGALTLSTSGTGAVSFNNTGTFTVAGNIDFNGTGTNDIAGTLNLSGNALTSSGALTVTPASGSNLNIALSTTGDFAVNTSQLYVDTSTGNVGIGTTSPTYKLDVYGTAAADAIRSEIGFEIGVVANSVAGSVTLAGLGAGNVDTGTHYYWTTFVTAIGETAPKGTSPTTVVVADNAINGQVTVTIPVSSDHRVTARKIYRSRISDGAGNYYNAHLVATISDNTTTTYTDNIADASISTNNSYWRENTTSKQITLNGSSAVFIGAGNEPSVAIGLNAGATIANGTALGGASTFVGSYAGDALTTGSKNNAFGNTALTSLTTGSANVGIGNATLSGLTSGGSNIGIGGNAGQSNQTGVNNVFVGYSAGLGVSGNSNSYNTGIGNNSLHGITTGGNNTALGNLSGYDVTTGSYNVLLGDFTTTAAGITTGSNNILIGKGVRSGLSQTGNNQLNIGNLIFGTSLGENATLSTGNVGIGTPTPGSLLEVAGKGAFGTAAATVAQMTVAGGASGTDIFQLVRTSGATLTYGWNLAGNKLSFNNVTNGKVTLQTSYGAIVANTSELNVGFDYGSTATQVGDPGLIKGSDSGGAGTDSAGGDLYITPGRGTGAATPAKLYFQTTSAGASGTTRQTLATRMTIDGSGNVGIGDTTPDGKLDVESTGAVTVTDYGLNLSNLTTNITTDAINKYGIAVTSTGSFTGSAGTATNNYGIYLTTTSGGDNNYQIYDQSGAYLSTAGTWTNAPSYRRYKEEFTGTEGYLDRLMTLDVYEWQYKDQKIDGINRYEDDPYRHASPFLDDFYSTFNLGTDRGYNIQDLAGVTLASVKELNQRFIDTNNQNETVLADLNLRTAENITTVAELQASVDTQLTVVGTELVNHDSRITNQETHTADLESQVTASQIQLASQDTRVTAAEALIGQIQSDINAQASQTVLLETQMQTLTEQLATLTDFYATFDLGNFVAKDTLGNVDLLDGKLRAKILETGALVIENAEVDAPTIGTAIILTGEKTVSITTGAVKSDSKIFVTPASSTALLSPLTILNKIAGESFEVGIPEALDTDITLDWWIVESKEGY